MKVALLNTKATPRSDYLLDAFAAGVVIHGDEVIHVRERSDLARLDAADVGVQVCFPNRHHDGSDLPMFRLEAYDRLHTAGKRVVTIDTGFVRSQPDAELARLAGGTSAGFRVDKPETYAGVDGSMYYAVGFDGIKRSADYANDKVTGDRWARMHVPVKTWRKVGGHVLLVGQPLHGLSSQHADIYHWYAEAAHKIRKVCRRPIIFRPHPRVFSLRTNEDRRRRDQQAVRRAVGNVRLFTYSHNRLLKDDLATAWATVVFTSNAAVESIIRGVPVIACDPACMAWDVAGHDLYRVDKLDFPDRQPWLNRLAYAQWSVTEMRVGQCWTHLRPHAVRAQ